MTSAREAAMRADPLSRLRSFVEFADDAGFPESADEMAAQLYAPITAQTLGAILKTLVGLSVELDTEDAVLAVAELLSEGVL